MTFEEISALVFECTYKPGWLVEAKMDGDRPFIQATVSREADASIDSSDPDNRVPWKSGKRYLSPHMCRQEVVGAVFALIKDAEMHEVHEWFRFRGASIYNPHLDPAVLADVARRKQSFNVRRNAMSMEEPAADDEVLKQFPDFDNYAAFVGVREWLKQCGYAVEDTSWKNDETPSLTITSRVEGVINRLFQKERERAGSINPCLKVWVNYHAPEKRAPGFERIYMVTLSDADTGDVIDQYQTDVTSDVSIFVQDLTHPRYPHQPNACPSKHWNPGNDICADCGTPLN